MYKLNKKTINAAKWAQQNIYLYKLYMFIQKHSPDTHAEGNYPKQDRPPLAPRSDQDLGLPEMSRNAMEIPKQLQYLSN